MILYSLDFVNDDDELDTHFVEAVNVKDAIEIWMTSSKMGIDRLDTISVIAHGGVVRRSRLKASA